MVIERLKARAGTKFDDIPPYAKADGSRIKIPTLASAPDPDKVNAYFDSTRTPAVLVRWNGASWVDVGTGGGGDLTYVHNQAVASTVWTVNHNLGKFPTPVVVDTAGNEFDTDIQHTSVNQLVATHSVATSGKVYCN